MARKTLDCDSRKCDSLAAYTIEKGFRMLFRGPFSFAWLALFPLVFVGVLERVVQRRQLLHDKARESLVTSSVQFNFAVLG